MQCYVLTHIPIQLKIFIIRIVFKSFKLFRSFPMCEIYFVPFIFITYAKIEDYIQIYSYILYYRRSDYNKKYIWALMTCHNYLIIRK